LTIIEACSLHFFFKKISNFVFAFMIPDTMILSSVFLTALSVAIGVQAQPRSIINTPIDGCSTLPRWNNETNIAGPWSLELAGCRNGTAFCSIEGYAATCDVKRPTEEKKIDRGVVCSLIPRTMDEFQAPVLAEMPETNQLLM
jgi:hypothetical protein